MSDTSLQRKRRAPMKYRKHTEASKRKLLEAYKERKNWRAVAIAYDMPLRTAQRIIATGAVQTKPRGGARHQKFSEEMKQHLIQAIQCNRKLTFREMASIILRQFQIKVTARCIAYNLQQMRNSLKMQEEHTVINSAVNIEKRKLSYCNL